MTPIGRNRDTGRCVADVDVSETASEAVSISVTVCELEFATHSRRPSGVIATPHGNTPTEIAAPAMPAAPDILAAFAMLATPAMLAMPAVLAAPAVPAHATSMARRQIDRRHRIRPALATNANLPSGAMAIASGSLPTAMVATPVRREIDRRDAVGRAFAT